MAGITQKSHMLYFHCGPLKTTGKTKYERGAKKKKKKNNTNNNKNKSNNSNNSNSGTNSNCNNNIPTECSLYVCSPNQDTMK